MPIFLLLLLSLIPALAFDNNISDNYGTITDNRDNKTYKTITIGKQTWMAENLNYNIDTSWCYNNDELNCEKYGRLYDWNTASRACPNEWRLPSRIDWELLKKTVGRMAEKLVSKIEWYERNEEYEWCFGLPAGGIYELGFSALPGGSYDFGNRSFYGAGWDAIWWSYEQGDKGAYYWNISSYDCRSMIDGLRRRDHYKEYGFSVRCIRNHRPNAIQPKNTAAFAYGMITDDRDSKIYKTITIGEQIWMAENLNYRTGNSWCYNNDWLSCQKHGRLYDQKTASRACPNEWHLPDGKEWEVLKKTLGNRFSSSFWNEDWNGGWWGTEDDYGKEAGYPIRCIWNHGTDRDLRIFIKAPVNFIDKWQKQKKDDNGKAAIVNDMSIIDPRDGQKYRVVKIGGLTWMAENLNYKAKGSLCYKDNELNCEKYGRLYDWNTASKACPSGWRLPSREDWDHLAKVTGGEFAGKKLRSKTEWNGTDIYGWSALPGGRKSNKYENFHGIGDHGYWWSSTPDHSPEYDFTTDGKKISFSLSGFVHGVGMSSSHNETFELGNGKTFYYSVRCIQD